MPKIIGGSLHEHRLQTRQRLFAALSALLSERAFDSFTLAEIAERAEIGRTAVYNHFADKEALLLDFIAHETERYVAVLEHALRDVSEPVEQLRTYVRQRASLSPTYHLAPGVDLGSMLARATQQRLRDHVVGVEGILRRILANGIASGAFPDQDLGTTVPLVHACLSGRGIPAAGPDRDRALAATEAFVLRAVGARLPAAAAAPLARRAS